MNIQVLECQLIPFKCFAADKDHSLAVEFLSDTEWCSLPDILYCAPSRVFAGLSFAVNRGDEDFAGAIVRRSASSRFRYVAFDTAEGRQRYPKFGPRDRIELLWWCSDEPLECEFASIFMGMWTIEDGEPNSQKNRVMPSGYRLMDAAGIAKDHHLSFPALRNFE